MILLVVLIVVVVLSFRKFRAGKPRAAPSDDERLLQTLTERVKAEAGDLETAIDGILSQLQDAQEANEIQRAGLRTVTDERDRLQRTEKQQVELRKQAEAWAERSDVERREAMEALIAISETIEPLLIEGAAPVEDPPEETSGSLHRFWFNMGLDFAFRFRKDGFDGKFKKPDQIDPSERHQRQHQMRSRVIAILGIDGWTEKAFIEGWEQNK